MAAAQQGRGSTECDSERGDPGACAHEGGARRPRGFQARDERTERGATCDPLGTFRPRFASRPPIFPPTPQLLRPNPSSFLGTGL